MTGSQKFSQTMTSKPLFFLGRLFLGAIFILASLDKIHHPAAFGQIVYNYQILSNIGVNLTAIILPWIELLLGIFLVFGRWLHGAIFLSNLILVVFSGLLIFNLSRGLDVNCGCFSIQATQLASTLWSICRDVLFLVLAIYLLIHIMLRPNPGILDNKPDER